MHYKLKSYVERPTNELGIEGVKPSDLVWTP